MVCVSGKRNVAALLEFLPVFEAQGFEPGTWEGGEADEDGIVQMPWFSYSPAVSDFVALLNRDDWLLPDFDWPAWQEEAQQLLDDPEGLWRADVPVLRQLLTLHVRKDRFCEGHLAQMFESGHVVATLKRIQDLDWLVELPDEPMPECPRCGRNDRVIPILWGMPGWEAGAAEKRGELKLGGCCVSDDDPSHHCKRCRRDFGER